MDGLPEDQLIAQCLDGNSAAWDELFDRFWAPAARFVQQLSPGFLPEDVEEITQETFLAVVRNLSSFNRRSQLQTWIFRIASNKARDFADKQNAAKRGGGQAVLSLNAELEPGLKLDPPSTAPSPDGVLLGMETMAMLRQALDVLGDPCREILELRYFGDLSYEEIGTELELNPKTVSSRLSKCLDKLEELARPLFEKENSRTFPV